jgi:chromosome segregation ATPase
MAEQPHWHPIAMLATIARHLDGMVEADQEQLETLQEARTRPYVLDDDTVSRVKRAFTTQREDFWIFEEQLSRWQALKLTTEQRAEVNRLQSQMARLRQINSDVLALAEELSKGTIEKQLAKSDFELGLEALLRMANGEDPLKG